MRTGKTQASLQTTVTITQRYGREGVGDLENEWLTDEEIEAKGIQSKAYIAECKAKGIYGKKYTMTISVENDETLDKKESSPTESYRGEIIDFSKLKK